MLFCQYWFSDKIALYGMHAHEVTPEQAPELHGVIDRLCALADMPKPRVAIADTDVPNAFATGRSPKAAVVCCTTGLLRRLDEPELEAVLAHELSHVAHRDVAVMTIASLLGMIAGLLTRMMFYAGLFGGGRRRQQQQRQPAGRSSRWSSCSSRSWSTPSASCSTMALSRYRELAADRSGALLIGRPSLLASALVKVTGEMGRIPTRDLRSAEPFNAFFFTPAIAQAGTQGGGGGFSFGQLFSHPPDAREAPGPARASSRPARPGQLTPRRTATAPADGPLRHPPRAHQAGPGQPRRPLRPALGRADPAERRRPGVVRPRRRVLEAPAGPGGGRRPEGDRRSWCGDGFSQAVDSFDYRWLLLDDPDLEDLVTKIHMANSTLAGQRLGPPAALLGLRLRARSPTRGTDAKAFRLVYLFKRGTFYPFAPVDAGKERRDTELELRIRTMSAPTCRSRRDLTRWFPMWDLPVS